MIFREPTDDLIDSSFELFESREFQGDATFGSDSDSDAGPGSGPGPDPALEFPEEFTLHPGPFCACPPAHGDAEFLAMFDQMRRELNEDPYHAGHCLFAHVALRGLAFADPVRVLRLLREEPLKMTRGAMFYASRIAPHVVASTLFRSDEVIVQPLDLPGWTGALIVMPPPTQPSGVHFAAALLPSGPRRRSTEIAWGCDHLEYITLEESLEITGDFTTTLGRRLRSEQYVEVGPGPDVDRTAFLEAVQGLLAAPRKSGTPEPPSGQQKTRHKSPEAGGATTTAAPGEAPRPKPSPKPTVA